MPATNTVWIVPGFMGSELYIRGFTPSGQPAPGRILVWPPFSTMFNGDAWPLFTWPTPPTFLLEVGQIVRPMGYDSFLRYISDPVRKPLDAYVREWPYDWRRDIDSLGFDLSSQILRQGGAPGSHMLFGHSLGAAIIMSAYKFLKRGNWHNLVSRVITLGGVIWGSYSTANTWLEHEDSLNLFASIPDIARFTTATSSGFERPFNSAFGISRTILDTFMSWPVTYDMLPDPNRGDDPDDTYRHLLWDRNAWLGALSVPDAAQLERARAYHAGAHNPDDWPNAATLAHIVGINYATPYRAQPSAVERYPAFDVRQPGASWRNLRRTLSPSLWSTSEGDKRVTISQQTVPGRGQLRVHGEHSELQNHPVVMEQFWPLMYGPLPDVAAPTEAPIPASHPIREAPTRSASDLATNPATGTPYIPTTEQVYAARKEFSRVKQVKQTIRDPSAVRYDRRGNVIFR